jgi:16S rRNA (adenine1518-N6/adenine1519-N6)-dimethyltransferase
MQPKLRDVITRHGLDARKSLGQHFLLDENLCAKIVRQAGDLAGRHVVEVGPGPGGLTRALLASPAASITAVEIDPRAVTAIRALQADHTSRLHIIEADAVSTDLATLTPAPRQIVANLPYNAGTAMLIGWLHQAQAWERMTLMFQQEVAERIVAVPATGSYGRLSVLVQLTCTANILMRVPPSAFTPPPSVMSAVVGLAPLAEQPSHELLANVERITAAAFGQRRKMLRGSLRGLGGAALLERVGIDPQRRAETLTVAEIVRLAKEVVLF